MKFVSRARAKVARILPLENAADWHPANINEYRFKPAPYFLSLIFRRLTYLFQILIVQGGTVLQCFLVRARVLELLLTDIARRTRWPRSTNFKIWSTTEPLRSIGAEDFRPLFSDSRNVSFGNFYVRRELSILARSFREQWNLQLPIQLINCFHSLLGLNESWISTG